MMLIECVPNFSEGRDEHAIAQIRDAIAEAGAAVLDSTSDRDHNRTVITFAGSPDTVERAAFAAAATAVATIDLRRHQGVHPRIGSIDVIPFVPVSGVTLEQCAEVAHRVARQVWDRLGLPSFFYESAGHGRPLEAVRRAAHANAPPDTGVGRHVSAGAAAIGARKFLVAWNINLHSTDLALAKELARAIRHSSGGFPGVKALGLRLESRGQVQVSINSTDFEATPLHVVFRAVANAAREAGVAVAGSELIGLIPERALNDPDGCGLPWENFEPRMVLENALQLRSASYLDARRSPA